MTKDYEFCSKELKKDLGILLSLRALNGDDIMAISNILIKAMERTIREMSEKNELFKRLGPL